MSYVDPQKRLEYQRRWKEKKYGRPVKPRGPNYGKYKDDARRSKVKRYGHEAVTELDNWDGVCDLCHQKDGKPTIDHDHRTGRFRGILCYACNVGLGLLGDSLTRLQEAVKYLQRQEE